MKPPFSDEEIFRIAQHFSESFEVLANRWDSAKVKIGGALYRFSKKETPLKNNAFALEYLPHTPKLLERGTLQGIYFSKEEWIEGKQLDRLPLSPLLLETILNALQNLHTLAGEQKNWSEALQERYGARFPHVEKEYVETFSTLLTPPKEPCLLHGMCERNNMVLRGKELFFIDFEDSLFGEKEFDIGALFFKDFFPLETLRVFCDASDYDLRKVLLYALYFGIKTVGKEKTPYKAEKVKQIFTWITELK